MPTMVICIANQKGGVGKTTFEIDPLCRAAKEYQALTQLLMKF